MYNEACPRGTWRSGDSAAEDEELTTGSVVAVVTMFKERKETRVGGSMKKLVHVLALRRRGV